LRATRVSMDCTGRNRLSNAYGIGRPKGWLHAKRQRFEPRGARRRRINCPGS
jgi:hypothetical protein